MLGALSPLDHVEPKEWDEVMAVNVTANWRLIRSLDPLLQRSDAGRAVFLTSGAACAAARLLGPYSVSKAALELMARIYAAETAIDHDAGQHVQSRAEPHPHARERDAGRGPDDAADAGEVRGEDRRPLPAGLRRDR